MLNVLQTDGVIALCAKTIRPKSAAVGPMPCCAFGVFFLMGLGGVTLYHDDDNEKNKVSYVSLLPSDNLTEETF